MCGHSRAHAPHVPMYDHRHDDVQVVQLEELEEVEHEQDPDTRDARPSAAVVSTDCFRLSR